jgi:hypothetical protein
LCYGRLREEMGRALEGGYYWRETGLVVERMWERQEEAIRMARAQLRQIWDTPPALHPKP